MGRGGEGKGGEAEGEFKRTAYNFKQKAVFILTKMSEDSGTPKTHLNL